MASLSPIGANSAIIWEWAAGIIGFMFIMVLVVAVVNYIKRLIDIS